MNINLTIDIMSDYFVYLISIPKTLYFNLRTLPFKDAIKLPFIVRYDTKLDISCGMGGGNFEAVTSLQYGSYWFF